MKLSSIALALISASLLAAGATAQPVGQLGGPSVATGHVALAAHANGPACGPVLKKQKSCGAVWVPGQYRVERRRVFVPARTQRVWHPPQYRTEYHCGKCVQVLVAPGHWDVVQVAPARYEIQRCRVWVAGHWK